MHELNCSLFKDLSPKIYDFIFYEKEIKICQGCQEKDILVKKWLDENTPVIGKKIELDSYGSRSDMYYLDFRPHLYGIEEKIGLFVKHLPNDFKCYNYCIKRIACLYQ